MNPDRQPQPLQVERVEWIPSSPDAIEVRVYGAWHGSTVPPAVELVVGSHREAALDDPPAPGLPPSWTAAFLAPMEARAELEAGGASLDAGGVVVPLPPAEPGAMDGPPGNVVDPAVLAERRARRAELAEETAERRAASAEETVETLRAQLAHLEERLARAAVERDRLSARIADAERRLRVAEQREEAERRRRSELEEEVAAARRGAESEVHELRARLSAAEEVTAALERELAHVRRRAETAVQAAERERAARIAAEERTAEADALRARAADLERRLAEAQPSEDLRARAAEADAVRARAAELERRLVAERDARHESELLRRQAELLEQRLRESRAGHADVEALERRVEALEQRLSEERAARAAAEQRLAAAEAEGPARAAAEQRLAAAKAEGHAREEALREQIAGLEAELARRSQVQARVQEAIGLVRDELAQVRSQVEAAQESGARESATVAALRTDLAALEQQRAALDEALRARTAELESTREELERARADAAVGADDAERDRDALAAAERSAAEARRIIADLEMRVADERHRREAAEADLAGEREQARMRTAAERAVARATPGEAEVVARRAGEEAGPQAGEESRGETGEPEDVALDTLIAGLREQVAAARYQLEQWGDAEAGRIGVEPPEAPAPREPARAAEGAAPPPGPETFPALDEPLPPKAGHGRGAAGAEERGETPAAGGEDDETRRRLQAIAAELRAAVPHPDEHVAANDVIAGLQRAAERLRAAAEEELERLERPEEESERLERPEAVAAETPAAPAAEAAATTEAAAAEESGAEAPAAEAPAAETPVPEAAQAPSAEAPPAHPAHPRGREAELPWTPGEEPAAPGAAWVEAESAAPAPTPRSFGAPAVEELGPRRLARAETEAPWLRVSLERLAARDPETAARLLAALLPAQATVIDDLTYDLTAPAAGTLRVTLAGGAARVEPRGGPEQRGDADVAVEGPLAALAPLAAGGAGWRLKGAKVRGSRRRLRRLLRARRAPVALADLAHAGAAPHPGLLLAALAAAVEPEWTVGHRFTVAYAVGGDGTWTVVAADGRPLQVAPATAAGEQEGPAATVRATSGALVPLLAGLEAPGDEQAIVVGDRRVVDALHAWFDRARGAGGA